MIMYLNPDDSTPIYKQIENEIIRAIFTGELKKGEEIPSIRQLGKDIGVNYHTIRKSYQELQNKGYINIDERSKTKVASDFSKCDDNELVLRCIEQGFKENLREASLKGYSREDLIELIDEELKNREV